MAAILYTLVFLMGGMLIVRLLLPLKRPLVRVYMGLALGVLLMMQLPALCARLLDFTLKAHMLALFLLLALTALCYPLRERRAAAPMQPQDRRQLAVMAAVGITLTVLSAYLQYTHILMPAPDGSLWCGQSTYGDLCMHLAFVTSMKDAAFPPAYNLLAGTPMAYPYLADSLSTSFLLLGLPLNWAMIVPGTLLMALTYAGYMLLAQQILGGRHKAVAVAALLFFFNGGLGFLYDFDMAFKDGFAKIREIFTG